LKPGAEEAPALKWVVELETDPSNKEGLEALVHGIQAASKLRPTIDRLNK
jgi:hypothetical protein